MYGTFDCLNFKSWVQSMYFCRRVCCCCIPGYTQAITPSEYQLDQHEIQNTMTRVDTKRSTASKKHSNHLSTDLIATHPVTRPHHLKRRGNQDALEQGEQDAHEDANRGTSNLLLRLVVLSKHQVVCVGTYRDECIQPRARQKDEVLSHRNRRGCGPGA